LNEFGKITPKLRLKIIPANSAKAVNKLLPKSQFVKVSRSDFNQYGKIITLKSAIPINKLSRLKIPNVRPNSSARKNKTNVVSIVLLVVRVRVCVFVCVKMFIFPRRSVKLFLFRSAELGIGDTE
jgi:hypothetical protein